MEYHAKIVKITFIFNIGIESEEKLTKISVGLKNPTVFHEKEKALTMKSGLKLFFGEGGRGFSVFFAIGIFLSRAVCLILI